VEQGAPKLFKEVSENAAEKFENVKPQELANIVWAYAAVDDRAPQLFEAVVEKAEERLVAMSVLLRVVCLATLLEGLLALQLPACASRLPAARAAFGAARTASMVTMCDAPAEEAAAPAAEEAVAVVEEAVAVVEEAVAVVEEAVEAPTGGKGKGGGTPIEELQVGQEVEGKIKSVMSYGAFVDVGASTDALLHVSEICNEFVKDASEKLTAGETITAKIKAINLEKNQLAITCKEPRERRPRAPKVDLSKFEGADDKEFVTGKVNSITDFGAFVTLEEGVDGLVHISQIQEGGVGQVSDVLKEGQEVQVRITSVDKAKRRIALSMLQWSEKSERPRRGGGFGGDMGFGEADKEFKMSVEEVEALAVGDEFAGAFESAFARAAEVQQSKASKSKYGRQVL